METDVIYLQESLTILPLSDEEVYIKQILTNKLDASKLDEKQKKKARVRVNTQGYSTNRDRLSGKQLSILLIKITLHSCWSRLI